MRSSLSAIARTALVVIIVVILVVAAAAAVYLSTSSKSTTSSTASTSTSASSGLSTSSSFTSSVVSTTSTSATSVQNLTMEVSLNPDGASPFVSSVDYWPQDLLYDPIFNYNVTTTSAVPAPWLATGYTANPSGSQWNITLRQGVTYSDGTQFNATSLKDTIQNYLIADATTNNLYTVIHAAKAYAASNHNSANQTEFINNDQITVVSPYVLDFNLTQPEADFLSYLSGPTAFFFATSPSAVIANGGITPTVGNTWFVSHSAGIGPYILQSYNAATGSMIFTANTHWWAIALGLKQPFPKITLNVVTNTATQELDVRTGVANLIALPASNIYDFADKTSWLTQNNLVSTVSGTNIYGPYLSTQFYAFEMNYGIKTASGTLASVQPFQNKNLVEAIDEAWNETAFIDADLNGFGVAHTGVLMEGQLGYQNIPPYYPYNLTAAAANIKLACQALNCSPSNPLQISVVSTNDQASELAGSLLVSTINSMQLGIVLNYEPLATAAITTVYLAGQFGIDIHSQPSLSPDPLSNLEIFVTPTGLQGKALSFNNVTINNLLTQAAGTSNVTQREALYLQIDKAIAQTGNFEQITQAEDVFVTSPNIHISNFNPALLATFPPILAF